MKYVIKKGDTLRMIAQDLLGDANLWVDIAELNGLFYPFISDTPASGTVSFGDTIEVPVEGETEEVKSTLGTDLKLSTDKVNLSSMAGGDLSVGMDGDYSLVSEWDCLRQDMAHKKMTILGTLPYHPEYGSLLNLIIGSKKDQNWAIKAKLETERVLRTDPRVTDVGDVEVTYINNGIAIKHTTMVNGVPFKMGGIGIDEEV